MRGDRPQIGAELLYWYTFTPHARGSTLRFRPLVWLSDVYPACAGIDPLPAPAPGSSARLPRMRGDRPGFLVPADTELRFTPHARGSTSERERLDLPHGVYPACAGIDRRSLPLDRRAPGLPRMRGDRPYIGCCLKI